MGSEQRIIQLADDGLFHRDNEALRETLCGRPSEVSYGIGVLCSKCESAAPPEVPEPTQGCGPGCIRGYHVSTPPAAPGGTGTTLDVRRVIQAVTNIAVRHGITKDPTPPLALLHIYGYSQAPADMDAEISAEYAALSPDRAPTRPTSYANKALGLPPEACNCGNFGNALDCPVHTQADYDAGVARRLVTSPDRAQTPRTTAQVVAERRAEQWSAYCARGLHDQCFLNERGCKCPHHAMAPTDVEASIAGCVVGVIDVGCGAVGKVLSPEPAPEPAEGANHAQA